MWNFILEIVTLFSSTNTSPALVIAGVILCPTGCKSWDLMHSRRSSSKVRSCHPTDGKQMCTFSGPPAEMLLNFFTEIFTDLERNVNK